jgi:agmatinase
VIEERWRDSLRAIPHASVIILGVPSDVGAGFRRGANFGPQALREALLAADSWLYRDPRVVDVGDVFVVPQLLHDDMLSEAQLRATGSALYATPGLPVSPLSIAERVLNTIRQLNPKAVPLVLGGDHSVGWPAIAAVSAGRAEKTGILHFDAHTDLLEERLGVRYCFATWAYHANNLVGRRQRLQQVGLRISGKTQEHWQGTLGVRQYWMQEMKARAVESVADEIVASLRAAGVQGLYISNDIDGTDPRYAAATGTAEPDGLLPEQVLTLIERVGSAFPVWGSDLVEVAPTLGLDQPEEPARTLQTAVRYIEAQAKVSLPPIVP